MPEIRYVGYQIQNSGLEKVFETKKIPELIEKADRLLFQKEEEIYIFKEVYGNSGELLNKIPLEKFYLNRKWNTLEMCAWDGNFISDWEGNREGMCNDDIYIDPLSEEYLLKELPPLIRRARGLYKDYRWLIENFKNNIHNRDTGEAWQWEFDIKIYSDIPDKVIDYMNRNGYQDIYWEELGRDVRIFTEHLAEDYDWIDYNRIYQVGRMGGWLAIGDDFPDENELEGFVFDGFSMVDTDEAKTPEELIKKILEYYREGVYVYNSVAFTSYEDIRHEIEETEYFLEELKTVIKVRMRDLPKIEREIEEAKKNVENELSSIQYWKEIFEDLE